MSALKTNLLPIEVENIERYTNIAFCQPSFYTRTAWNRAKKCVNKLIELGLAEPYDYGRGKGKYTLTPKGDEIGLGNVYKELVKIDFILTIRK